MQTTKNDNPGLPKAYMSIPLRTENRSSHEIVYYLNPSPTGHSNMQHIYPITEQTIEAHMRQYTTTTVSTLLGIPICLYRLLGIGQITLSLPCGL